MICKQAIRRTATSILLITLSIAAIAGEDVSNKQPLCIQPGMSDADIFSCWKLQAKSTDEAIQYEYSSLMKELSTRALQLEMLQSAQEAWIRYREAASRYQEVSRGACNYPQHCLVASTRYFSTYQSISAQRLSELKLARVQLAVLGLML